MTILGETLKEMIEELEMKPTRIFLDQVIFLKPKKVKIKYPLKRNANGRMMKPEREEI